MMCKHTLISGFLLSATLAFAQPVAPSPQLEFTYGGSEADEFRDVVTTPDGGLLAIGNTHSRDGIVKGQHGKSDVWLVRTKADGTVLWQICLGGSESDYAHGISRIANNYVMVAGTRSTDGTLTGFTPKNTDAWVVWLSDAGTILNQTVLGSEGTDALYKSVGMPNGNVAFVGQKGNLSGSDAEVWVVVTDATGNVLQQKTFGGSAYDRAQDIIATKDGGFLIVGQSYSSDGDLAANAGGGDFWVLRLKPDLSLAWQRTLGKAGMDVANAAVELKDGSFMIAGNAQTIELGKSAYEGEIDGWMVKLGPTGATEWERRLGGRDHEMLCRLIPTSDGGFVVAGWYGEGQATHDMAAWVAELNNSGDIRWQHKITGQGGGSFNGVVETAPGEFALVGWTRKDRMAKNEAWVVRLTNNVRSRIAVTDSTSGKPLVAEVIVIPFGKTESLPTLTTSADGSVEQWLAPGKYQLSFKKAGYADKRLLIEIVQQPGGKPYQQTYKLAPLKAGARVTLNKIYFEQKSAVLTQASSAELDKVVAFLKERSTVRIRIEGHTAAGGKEEMNVALSQQRAQAVLDYMTQHGIDTKRLEAVGFGSSRPVADNSDAEGQRLNRRIEFEILGE